MTVLNESIESVQALFKEFSSTAVEEQSPATRDIASNIIKTSQGIQEVSEHVSKTAQDATCIRDAISDMNQSTAQIADNSSQVNLSSQELSTLAETLKGMAARFQL